jgi:cellulose synthase operon protein C
MVPSKSQMAPTVARIRNIEGAIYGAAFRMGGRHLLTCGHVVDDALVKSSGPHDQVHLDFLLPEPSSLLTARVIAKWPETRRRKQELDIALLEFITPPPPLTTVPDLLDIEASGHDFEAFGFSMGHDSGIWARGQIRGEVGNGTVQVENVDFGGEVVEQGFSGTPVWDATIGCVVGIVVLVETEANLRTAYFLPARAIGEVFSEVAEVIQESKDRRAMEEQERASEAWNRATQRLLRYPPPVPRVHDVDPYRIGVSRSKYAEQEEIIGKRAKYVRRDVDRELQAALHTSPFTLVVGASKAGKSRTAFEAALHVLPNVNFVDPDRTEHSVLERLTDEFDPPVIGGSEPTLVWLDDLHEFFGPAGLDSNILDRWAASKTPVRVLATIRSEERDRLRDAKQEFGSIRRQVLERAHSIFLDSLLSARELSEASQAYPDEDLSGGIGEALTATRELLARFQDGLATSPAGVSLVRAAVDWRRAGAVRPISEAELRSLAADYLGEIAPNMELSDLVFQNGIAWARRPVVSHQALLRASGEDRSAGYVPFDYIVSYIEQQYVPIPSSTWDRMVDWFPPDEIDLIAFSAWSRGNVRVAATAFEKATRSTDEASARRAKANGMLAIGMVGNIERVREIYEELRSGDDRKTAEQAAFNLGAVLKEAGEVTEAERLFLWSTTSDDALIAAAAWQSLGKLRRDSNNDLRGAEQAFEVAIRVGDPLITPSAELDLARILQTDGRTDKAKELLLGVAESSNRDAAAEANMELGLILVDEDMDGARQAFEKAASSENPSISARAWFIIGADLKEQEDYDGADNAFGEAIRKGERHIAAEASYSRASMRGELNDIEGAREDLERAVQIGGPTLPRAAFFLGQLLESAFGGAGAEQAYTIAYDSQDESYAPYAALYLAHLFERSQRFSQAARWYGRVTRSRIDELIKVANERLTDLVRQGLIDPRDSQEPYLPDWAASELERAAHDERGGLVKKRVKTGDGDWTDVVVDKSGAPLTFSLNVGQHYPEADIEHLFPEHIYGKEPMFTFVAGKDGLYVILLNEHGRPVHSAEWSNVTNRDNTGEPP